MRSKYRELTNHMFLFGIGSLIPKLLAMLAVPIVTAFLSTADYGIAELINSSASLLIALFTLNIQDSVLRFALDVQYDNKQVFSTALRIFFKGSIFMLTVLVLLYTLKLPFLKPSYLLLLSLSCLTLSFHGILSRFCRGIDQVAVLTKGAILGALITFAAYLLFLPLLHWGLSGYLLAAAIGSFCSSLYCFHSAKLSRYLCRDHNPSLAQGMLSYSLPLLLSTLLWWLGSASDRYLLSWFCGIAVSGLYAVSFKIPAIFSAVQSIFLQAWSISAIKEFDPDDREHFISNTYKTVSSCLYLLCSALLIMNIPLTHLLCSGEFSEAWKYTPILLFALVFQGLSLFTADLFHATKAPAEITRSMIVGITLGVIFNFLLIPRFAAYGAAISALLNPLLTCLIRFRLLRNYLHPSLCSHRDKFAWLLLSLQTMLACFGWNATPFQLPLFLFLLFLYRRNCLHIIQLTFRLLQKTSEKL